MQGQFLDAIDRAWYLCVDISSDLNFSHHNNHVTANASKSLYFLKRSIKTKYPGKREAAYKTTIRPQVGHMHHLFGVCTLKRHS